MEIYEIPIKAKQTYRKRNRIYSGLNDHIVYIIAWSVWEVRMSSTVITSRLETIAAVAKRRNQPTNETTTAYKLDRY